MLWVGIVASALASGACMLRGFAGLSAEPRRSKLTKSGRVAFFVSGSLALLVLIRCAVWIVPRISPERHLDDVARSGAPMVEALDRFTAAHGKPPRSLWELAPEFLNGLPPTECGPFESWDYIGPQWVLHDQPNSWRLSVPLERFPLGYGSDERFEFNSWDRRWIYRR